MGVRENEGAGKPLGMLPGLKVVEMGQNLAAPYASLILGDLGAEVIKVEKPGLTRVAGARRSWARVRSVST
ncbi:hypothetical protein SHIRM173S_04478 [Streptomyces hirsutus]